MVLYIRLMTTLDHPSKRLGQALKRYAEGPTGLSALNSDQVTQIMRHVRRLIDKDGLQAEFATAKLFGDWLQHNELSNPTVVALIERLNIEIANSSAIDLIVPHVLGMGALRTDLLAIFKRFSLPDDLLETASLWMRFGGLLLEEISGTPLKFPPVVSNRGRPFDTLTRIHQASKNRYGEPSAGDPLWFDSLLIETEPDEEDFFVWRLEFGAPDGSRAGVRGRVVSTDGRPFRNNDLNINFTSDAGAKHRAIEKLLDARPKQRIVEVMQTPTSSED